MGKITDDNEKFLRVGQLLVRPEHRHMIWKIRNILETKDNQRLMLIEIYGIYEVKRNFLYLKSPEWPCHRKKVTSLKEWETFTEDFKLFVY